MGTTNETIAREAQASKRVANMVIAELADSEAALAERVGGLAAENVWLRDTVREAVDLLHRANVQRDRANARILTLVAELRDARSEIASIRARLHLLEDRAA